VVSDLYAGALDCPVFLPPVPPSVPLWAHLLPWQGRNIWLELGLDGEAILLTGEGSSVTSLPRFFPSEEGFSDTSLHCHYTIDVNETARFTLWRTREDLKDLIKEAEELGVSGFVGLYQELETSLYDKT